MYDELIKNLRHDSLSALQNCEFDFVHDWMLKAADAIEDLITAFVIQDPKPITNADKIRTMTDEELAWFIYTKTGCDHKCMHWKSKSCSDPDSAKVCGEVWLDWLKQESEGKQWQS